MRSKISIYTYTKCDIVHTHARNYTHIDTYPLTRSKSYMRMHRHVHAQAHIRIYAYTYKIYIYVNINAYEYFNLLIHQMNQRKRIQRKILITHIYRYIHIHVPT